MTNEVTAALIGALMGALVGGIFSLVTAILTLRSADRQREAEERQWFATFYLKPQIDALLALQQALLRIKELALIPKDQNITDIRAYHRTLANQCVLADGALMDAFGAALSIISPASIEEVDKTHQALNRLQMWFLEVSNWPEIPSISQLASSKEGREVLTSLGTQIGVALVQIAKDLNPPALEHFRKTSGHPIGNKIPERKP